MGLTWPAALSKDVPDLNPQESKGFCSTREWQAPASAALVLNQQSMPAK
jgi:hypothetical protein